MEANELKNRLTVEMTMRLIEFLGAELYQENEEYCIYTSICHCNPNSKKLYFYKQTNSFYCFSQCGGLDIISIVQQVEGLEFKEAIQWIVDFFQLEKKVGFGKPPKIKYEKKEIKPKEVNVDEKLPTYNESILNTFYSIPIAEWLNEGISKEIMDLFEIKYSIDNDSIIIPCRDMESRLVGIRCRNLNEKIIEEYGKYGVYTDNLSKISYKCLTGKLLYGLNINKKRIQENKTIIIVEGEKSVLKSKTWFGDNDITVASYGANLTNFQIEIIKSLGVKKIIFAYDKEYNEKILNKIEKIYRKTALLFDVYYINDDKNLLKEKDSPLDNGENIYRELLNNMKKYEVF